MSKAKLLINSSHSVLYKENNFVVGMLIDISTCACICVHVHTKDFNTPSKPSNDFM